MSELYFQTHIFTCTNSKDESKQCCANAGAEAVWSYLKKRAKALGLPSTRVSRSGCLGRCAEGPVTVIYPSGEWVRLMNEDDAESLLQALLQNTPIPLHLRA